MKKIFVIISLLVPYLTLSTTYGVDILERIYTPSKQNNQVVDMGNNKTAVWNEVFKQSIDIITWEVKDSLVVRITKTILRWVLIIGISMGIVVWIKYIFSQWDEWEQKKLQWYLRNIIYGILIAFWALVIVELILSITRTSVTF